MENSHKSFWGWLKLTNLMTDDWAKLTEIIGGFSTILLRIKSVEILIDWFSSKNLPFDVIAKHLKSLQAKFNFPRNISQKFLAVRLSREHDLYNNSRKIWCFEFHQFSFISSVFCWLKNNRMFVKHCTRQFSRAMDSISISRREKLELVLFSRCFSPST